MRYAITGATGWLGRAATEVVASQMSDSDRADHLLLFASCEQQLVLDDGQAVPVHPLIALPDMQFDVLLHYAYVTRERFADHGLGDYLAANLGISAIALRAIRAQRPRAVVLASSGAAAAAEGGLTTVAGDPYGHLKVFDELAFRQAAADVGARRLILRVYNVSGRWIAKPDTFVLSDFIRQALTDGRIIVRASHPVRRSYIDVEDLAAVATAFAVSSGAPDDLLVGTAGDRVVEVGELADMVATECGLQSPEIERTWDPSAPADDYFDASSGFRDLARALGVPVAGLAEQVARTARVLALGTLPRQV